MRETVIAGIGRLAAGLLTRPEQVATLVVMLASDRTADVTGANRVIDGDLMKTAWSNSARGRGSGANRRLGPRDGSRRALRPR